MPLHVFGDQSAVEVVAAAWRGGDDVSDSLALEEIGAGLREGRRGKEPGDDQSSGG